MAAVVLSTGFFWLPVLSSKDAVSFRALKIGRPAGSGEKPV